MENPPQSNETPFTPDDLKNLELTLGLVAAAGDDANTVEALLKEMSRTEVALNHAISGLTAIPRNDQPDNNLVYYSLGGNLVLTPQRGTVIQRVEIRMVFNPEMTADDAPKVADIFPASKWRDQMHADVQWGIDISSTLQFVASLVPGVGAEAAQAIKPLAVFFPTANIGGTWNFVNRTAAIKGEGVNGQSAYWLFEGRDLFQQNAPVNLGLILAMPRTTREFEAAYTLNVHKRNESLGKWAANAIHNLREMGTAVLQRRLKFDPTLLLDRLEKTLREDWNVENPPATWKLTRYLTHLN